MVETLKQFDSELNESTKELITRLSGTLSDDEIVSLVPNIDNRASERLIRPYLLSIRAKNFLLDEETAKKLLSLLNDLTKDEIKRLYQEKIPESVLDEVFRVFDRQDILVRIMSQLSDQDLLSCIGFEKMGNNRNALQCIKILRNQNATYNKTNNRDIGFSNQLIGGEDVPSEKKLPDEVVISQPDKERIQLGLSSGLTQEEILDLFTDTNLHKAIIKYIQGFVLSDEIKIKIDKFLARGLTEERIFILLPDTSLHEMMRNYIQSKSEESKSEEIKEPEPSKKPDINLDEKVKLLEAQLLRLQGQIDAPTKRTLVTEIIRRPPKLNESKDNNRSLPEIVKIKF